MENRGSTDNVDDVVKDSSGKGIQEEVFVEEFSSELPSMVMSSLPSGSHPYTSVQELSSSKGIDHDDRGVAHAGIVGDTKKLEHALPGEAMSPTGLGMIDSTERPPPVSTTSNHEVTPGAFHVVPSSHNTATNQTLRSRPRSSYDSTRELTNEESKHDDGVSNPAGASHGTNDSTRGATESDLYTVEDQPVPDGNEEQTMIVAEAKSVEVKWSQRRWISLGLALFASGLVVAVVVLVVRQPSAATTSSSLTSPTAVPSIVSPIPVPMSASPTAFSSSHPFDVVSLSSTHLLQSFTVGNGRIFNDLEVFYFGQIMLGYTYIIANGSDLSKINATCDVDSQTLLIVPARRTSRLRFLQDVVDNATNQVEYTIQWASNHVNVTDYPILFSRFVEQNLNNLTADLQELGLDVVSASSLQAVIATEAPSAAP